MLDIGISEKEWEMLMVHFEGEEMETISVFRKCPECCKIIRKGDLLMNKEGDVKLKGWLCNTHGEVNPFFVRF